MADDNTQVSLSDRIRCILGERGMSQATLADLAGVSTSMLSRLLSGQRAYNLYSLEQIAKAFDLSPPDLVVGTDHEDMIKAMGTLVPREEFEKVNGELADALSKVQELTATVSGMEATQGARDDQIKEMALEHAAVADDLAGVTAKYADAQSTTRRAISERDEARRTLDEALAERDEAIIRVDEARAQANTTRSSLVGAQSLLRTRNAEAHGLRSEITMLRRQLEEANQQTRTNYDAYRQMELRVQQFEDHLEHVGKLNVGWSIFTALVGATAGAVATAAVMEGDSNG